MQFSPRVRTIIFSYLGFALVALPSFPLRGNASASAGGASGVEPYFTKGPEILQAPQCQSDDQQCQKCAQTVQQQNQVRGKLKGPLSDFLALKAAAAAAQGGIMSGLTGEQNGLTGSAGGVSQTGSTALSGQAKDATQAAQISQDYAQKLKQDCQKDPSLAQKYQQYTKVANGIAQEKGINAGGIGGDGTTDAANADNLKTQDEAMTNLEAAAKLTQRYGPGTASGNQGTWTTPSGPVRVDIGPKMGGDTFKGQLP